MTFGVLEMEQDYRILKGTQISYLNYWSKKSEHTVLCFVPLPVFFLPFFDHLTFVLLSKKGKKENDILRGMKKNIFTFTFAIPFTVAKQIPSKVLLCTLFMQCKYP